MSILTYDMVQVQGAITMDSLIELDLAIKPNQHGSIKLVGIINREIAFSELEGSLQEAEIKVVELDEKGAPLPTPIFYGLIQSAVVTQANGFYYVEVQAVSGTIVLDRQKKSRSFQNVGMSYMDVVKLVLKDTPKASAIFSEGIDRAIEKPIIQYEETDWEFIRRLASHFRSAIIPDCQSLGPHLWFGMRQQGEEREFSQSEYEVHVDEKYYRMGGKSAGLRRKNFFYYLARGGNYRIGDTATFQNKPLIICEQYGVMKKGELVFSSKLGDSALIGEREYYNEAFAGLSLEGTVAKTDRELLQIQLDIDGNQKNAIYPYEWMPPSGNMMYCMPKLGTRVSLYFPSHDERKARAVNCIRQNGASCGDTADYTSRYLTSEHGKRMKLCPGSMGFSGVSGVSTPLQIELTDKKQMLAQSHGIFRLIAQNQVLIEAPNVVLGTPLEIKTVRTTSEIAARRALIVPKGTK